MKYSNLLPISLILASGLFAVGCASSSALQTSNATYAETEAESIQILTQYPTLYETVGLVEASAPKGYLRKPQHATKNAIAALKKQAASLGANAVILKDYSSSRVSDFSLGNEDDLGLIFSTEHKHVTAEAIRIL